MAHIPERINLNNNNVSVISFETFLEGWFIRQQHYLDQLISAHMNYNETREEEEEELRGLVTRVLAHYREYYEEKSRAATRDIFLVLAPTWLNSFERTFLWIGGFKPGLVFQLVTNSVEDLSKEQLQRLERLRRETIAEEKELDEELARVQRSVVAPPLLEITRREVNGGWGDADEVLEGLRNSLEILVECAENVRGNTVIRVVDILRPIQTVKFLAAAVQLQLRIRRWGLEREAERM